MDTAIPADGRSSHGPLSAIGHAPLVGRAHELGALRAVLTQAPASPQIFLITGESGIGKSRLLTETQALARAAHWAVLCGEADEQIGALPYLPWLAVLRACVAAHDTADQQLTAIQRASLTGLLPELAGDPSPRIGQPQSPTEEAQKLRLFDAITDLLTSRASAHPTLLILDDIQWFDHASAELLRYVAARVVGPLLFLLAGRDEDLPRNVTITRTLDDLNRRRLLRVFPLRRMTEGDIALLLTASTGSAAPQLAHALHRHSEGNPFFAEEVLKALVEEDRLNAGGDWAVLPLPRGVVAVLEQRLERLGAACLALLRVAALVGRRFPLEAVASAAELSDDAAGAALDEAAAAAVLRPPVAGEAWGEFAHDRIREVLLARLNPLRRRTLHLRLARALELQPGRHDAAQLAHHYARGHDYGRAVHYARRAAAAARQAHAYTEAATFSQDALRLCDEGDLALPDGERAALLAEHGAHAALQGDYAAALASYGAAATIYRRDGDRRAAGGMQRQIGALHARREDVDSALAHYRLAIDLLGEDLDSADTAELLIQFGAIHGMSMASYATAIDYGQRGLAMATRLDAPGLAAGARLALANTILRTGDLHAGHIVLQPALDLALRADDANLGAEICAALANYYYWTADLQHSQTATERRRDLALQSGDPYALRHVYSWLAHLAYVRGHWAEAIRHLDAAEPILARLDSPEPRAFQQQIAGLIAFQRGDTAVAVALLAEPIATFRRIDPGTLIWYLGCYGRAQLAAGDAAGATATLAELDTLIDQLPDGALPRAPALAQLGLAAIDLADAPLARRTYARLHPYTGQHHWVLMDRALGALAAYLEEWPAAADYLAAAEQAATRGGILPELALTLAARATLHLQRGEQAQARATLLAARAQFAALGMAAEEQRAGVGLAALDTAVVARYPAGLSAREVEVLGHVAAGRTNREIADLLSISERTVNNHVAHILAKTNTDNRAAAAAFALRHGLA